jgi:CheY-like chemotaxis protein
VPKTFADIVLSARDGLTCARRIREDEQRGLLALPPDQSNDQARLPLSSLTLIQNPGARPERHSFRIPILAVSANVRKEQIQHALDAGMDDAITKPFRIVELWPKMRDLIPGLADIDESKV